jgi:hypothetical protein
LNQPRLGVKVNLKTDPGVAEDEGRNSAFPISKGETERLKYEVKDKTDSAATRG